MREAIEVVENACTLPISIDADEPEVLEEGLIHVSGIPLINSVTAERQKLARGMKLAKRYGACLVVLTIDEEGIATTPEERIRVAERVGLTADELNFPRNRIFVDPLTMPIAADARVS